MKLSDVAAALRTHALSLPGATEEFPWGERVIKVNKKVFIFMGMAADDGSGGFGFSVKLPISGESALALPFARPTGYGLGKSGWVSLRFAPADEPDLTLLQGWVEESWRAVAPKRLSREPA